MTQPQNEAILEKAFDELDKVYLIFSANKSGEYFGYAQPLRPMPFNGNEASLGSELEAANNAYPPRSISTPATSTAPKGRIVDDSTRGTFFWEGVLSDEENDDKLVYAKSESGSNQDRGGRVFAIEWLSKRRVPFYRTRGLRIPWNNNQEVKIGAATGNGYHPDRATSMPFWVWSPQPRDPGMKRDRSRFDEFSSFAHNSSLLFHGHASSLGSVLYAAHLQPPRLALASSQQASHECWLRSSNRSLHPLKHRTATLSQSCTTFRPVAMSLCCAISILPSIDRRSPRRHVCACGVAGKCE